MANGTSLPPSPFPSNINKGDTNMKKHIAALLVALATGCATPVNAPTVPANLQAPAGQALTIETAATGVQIYECRAGKWEFRAPEADLFDRKGNKIGTHYA